MGSDRWIKGYDQILLQKVQALLGDRRSEASRALRVSDLTEPRSVLVEKITEIANARAKAAVASIATDRTSPTGRALLQSLATAVAADRTANDADGTLNALIQNARERSSIVGEFSATGDFFETTPWTEMHSVEFGPVRSTDLWLTSGAIELRPHSEGFSSNTSTHVATFTPQATLNISIQKNSGDPWSAPISVIDFTGASNPPWSIFRVTDAFSGVAHRVRYATSCRTVLFVTNDPEGPGHFVGDIPEPPPTFRDSVLICKLLRQ